MEAEKEAELVNNGSFLRFLDVPQYTLIGIDTQVFSAGPIFKGIKMIPHGVHFVFHSSSTRDGKEFSPAVGFFADTSPSEACWWWFGNGILKRKGWSRFQRKRRRDIFEQ